MNHHRPDRLRIPRAERLRRKTNHLADMFEWCDGAPDEMDTSPDWALDEPPTWFWTILQNNPHGRREPRHNDLDPTWMTTAWTNNP